EATKPVYLGVAQQRLRKLRHPRATSGEGDGYTVWQAHPSLHGFFRLAIPGELDHQWAHPNFDRLDLFWQEFSVKIQCGLDTCRTDDSSGIRLVHDAADLPRGDIHRIR